MSTKILFKRGQNAAVPSITLAVGEPAFATDTGKLYVGGALGKYLINPIDKPLGIIPSAFYPKVSVNDYGQVIAQSNLSAADIPTIPSSKVSGLGTCSAVNTGILSGQIPTLDAGGKFPSSVIPPPSTLSSIYAYYSGVNVAVAVNAIVPMSASMVTGTAFSLDGDGYINMLQAGTYLVNYHVTSISSSISTALSAPTGGYWSGTASTMIGTAAITSSIAHGTLVRTIAAAEKIGIRNVGLVPFTISTSQVGISIVKIG